MSTYGLRSPLRATFTMCRRAIGSPAQSDAFRRFLRDNSDGPASSVDEFQSNGRSSEDYRPGMGGLCAVECRSEVDLRNRAGPYRVRLAPTHDSGRRWTGSWTDAYLAAFAEAHSYSLVTFDSGFERWPALKLTLLSSAQNLPGK
jgi:hypothetical protein